MSQFFVLAASCCAVFISCLTISSAAISCGSDIYLSAGIGTSLTSDNHPSNYPSGICKKWRITAPLGKRVKLEFISFDLYGYPTCSKSSDDTLKIYDSSIAMNLLGSYCGRYIPADVVSSGRNLYLVFYSNNKITSAYKGFKLEYSAVSKPATDSSTCSPYNANNINNNIQLRATSYKQYIQSPLYPKKYPSNIECIWYIKASSTNRKIKLTVTTMRIYNYNLQSCGSASDYDFLKITDGSSTYDKTLKEMCSSQTYSSETVTSSGQYMTVRFKTNVDNYFSAATSGFKAEYDESDHNSDSASGVIVGAIFACLIVIGLVLCCICIVKRQRTSGQVMRQAPAVTTATTTTTTTQYPMQPQAPLPPQGTYPQAGASYPPPAAGGYPPAPPGSSYPPQGGYPPPGSNIPPPQASYPPPGSSYPPPGSSYPPPTQGSYPPPSDPPPQYPGPPAYPPQPPFNPSQPNPPYPPAPQGGGASQQYPPPVDTKASAPPPF